MSDFVGQSPTPAEGSPIPVDPLLNSLSVREVAAFLGCDPQTVRRRCQSGEIPARKVRTNKAEEWRVYRQGPFLAILPAVDRAVAVPQQAGDVAALLAAHQQMANEFQQLTAAIHRLADEVAALRADQAQQGQQHDQQALPAPRRPWWRVWGRR